MALHRLHVRAAATDMLVNMCPILQESRQSHVIATLAVTTTLALAAVIMRLCSRRIANTKISWDDYFIIFAMVLPRSPRFIALVTNCCKVIALGETANIAVSEFPHQTLITHGMEAADVVK